MKRLSPPQFPPGLSRAVTHYAAPIGIGVVVFLYRFLVPDFENDHYLYLAYAQQILAGEIPVWDFVEPGTILQTTLSTVALALSNRTLLGEALLTSGFLGLAAGLTYSLTLRISGSRAASLVSTTLAVILYPRLYNYPKIFVYPAALWAIWGYLDRADRRRLWALAGFTVMAFLFRHDHGLYVALVAALALVLLQLGADFASRASRVLVSYAALVTLMILPFVLFVAASGHALSYTGFLGRTSSAIASTGWSPPPFFFDANAPWLRIADPPTFRVHVRWLPNLDARSRETAERRYGLAEPEQLDAETWRYALKDTADRNIEAIVRAPEVADTQGIDRSRFRLDLDLVDVVPAFLATWVPPVRIRPFPGFFVERNALPWLAWVCSLLPFLAALQLWIHARANGLRSIQLQVIPLIAMCALILVTLVRGSYDSRLVDVSSPMAILGGWVVATGLRRLRLRDIRGPGVLTLRVAGALVIVGLVWVTAWSAAIVGRLPDRLRQSTFSRPTQLPRHGAEIVGQFVRDPLDVWAPEGSDGIRALVRYVIACTEPSSRLQVVGGFEPRPYYYSGRRFAAGRPSFFNGWYSSETDQTEAVAKWSTQDVPVVLAVEERWRFAAFYPLVSEFVLSRYQVAGIVDGGGSPITVLTERSRATLGTYDLLNLPCFVPFPGQAKTKIH